jgi:hypothetical protein
MNSNKKIKIKLSSKQIFDLDQKIRISLHEQGHLDKEGLAQLSDKSTDDTVELQIDPEIAARFSEILRNELISASASHQANNKNIASAFEKFRNQ